MPGTTGSADGSASADGPTHASTHGSAHGTVRDEAERLVATFLAMVAQGSSRSGGPGGGLGDVLFGALGHAATAAKVARATAGWATGEPACCVCPLCRIIDGLRDPSPQTVEKLATGAGDFAAGVASLLRSLNDAGVARPAPARPPAPRPADSETVWRAATDRGTVRHRPGPAEDPWSAATTEAHDAATREAAQAEARAATEREARAAADRADRAAAAVERAAARARSAPAADKTAPAADKTAPAADKTAPAADKTAPVGDKTAPAADKTAPVGDKTVAGRGATADPWAAATRGPATRGHRAGHDHREQAGAEPATGHDRGAGEDAR